MDENKKPESLDILIVEDKEINLCTVDGIRAQGHNVDVATSLSDAITLLGGQRKRYASLTGAKKHFDVVMTDLMLPYGEGCEAFRQSGGPDPKVEEAPLGYAIALNAARMGIPLIAIVTDMNHHMSPVASTFDLFYLPEGAYATKGTDDARPAQFGSNRFAFRVNDSLVVLYDSRDFPQPGKIEPELYGTMKNYAAALDSLLEQGRTQDHI